MWSTALDAAAARDQRGLLSQPDGIAKATSRVANADLAAVSADWRAVRGAVDAIALTRTYLATFPSFDGPGSVCADCGLPVGRVAHGAPGGGVCA